MIRPIIPACIVNLLSGASTLINAMIDTGANQDVISERLTKGLDIHVHMTVLRVVTVDNEICTECPLASFSIESLDGEHSATINNALMGNVLTG